MNVPCLSPALLEDADGLSVAREVVPGSFVRIVAVGCCVPNNVLVVTIDEEDA